MSNRLIGILKSLVILLIPILVIGSAVRLLATDQYLTFEYGKTSFPPDPYGYTQRQRFVLASTNIHYVTSHLPSDELSRQTMNGVPVYNAREVEHMADVLKVFQSVMQVWQIASFLQVLMVYILWHKREHAVLALAVQSGGVLTVALVGSIALLALFAWQVWFDNFHLIFFEPGSWVFSYSDTLIRLFPVKFWFDATLTISLFSLAGGLLLAFLGGRWQKALRHQPG